MRQIKRGDPRPQGTWDRFNDVLKVSSSKTSCDLRSRMIKNVFNNDGLPGKPDCRAIIFVKKE